MSDCCDTLCCAVLRCHALMETSYQLNRPDLTWPDFCCLQMNWDGCAIAPEVFSSKFQPYPNRTDYKYPTIVSLRPSVDQLDLPTNVALT